MKDTTTEQLDRLTLITSINEVLKALTAEGDIEKYLRNRLKELEAQETPNE